MSYTDIAAQRLGAAYSGVTEEQALGLSFGDILGPLLDLLLGLLKDCFAGGTPASAILAQARRPTLWLRLRLRLRAREAGLDPQRATEALLSCAKTATAEELSGFVAENLG